jgi:photosystem II stability/assembly factor-like uncharacterized protein
MKKQLLISLFCIISFTANITAQNNNFYVDTVTKVLNCDDSLQLSASFSKVELLKAKVSINKYFFQDSITWYAVGNAGAILKTTHAGNSWVLLTSGITTALNNIYFINTNIGYAVGESGKILKTINAGGSWSELTSNTNKKLNSVHFTDLNNGYAVGDSNVILKTINAGATWTFLTVPSGTLYNNSINLNSINFSDSLTGYAVGDSSILKTTNAGITWVRLQTSNYSELLNSIYIKDSVNIFVSGEMDVYNLSKNLYYPYYYGVGFFFGIQFSSFSSFYFKDTIGYMVGSYGKIYKTTNTGNSWIALSSGTTNNLLSVFFTNTNIGYVLDESLTIFKTSNAGATWLQISNNIIMDFKSIYYIDSITGYAVGSLGRIYKTTNAGLVWSTLTSGINTDLNSIYFTQADTGYAVGASGKILKTTNAGTNWSVLTSGTTNALNSVFFTNSSTGYAVGVSGKIIKTSNAGINWSTLISGTTNALNSVYFTNSNTGYVVGASNTIRKTTNAGSTWVNLISGTTNVLNSVYFIDDNIGFAVGSSGKILKTTNAGSNWTTLISGTSNTLNSINFKDSNTGYIIGNSGTILKTINAGNLWSKLLSSTTYNLISICFSDSNEYFLSTNGSVLTIKNNENVSFNWSPNIGLSNPNISNPISKLYNTITYKVTITPYSYPGLSYTDSVKVIFNPLAVNITANNTMIVCGDSIQLNAVPNNSNNGNYTYSWVPDYGINIINIVNPKVAPDTSTSYIVTMQSNNLCGNPVDTFKLTVNPLIADAGSNKTIICGSTAQLNNITTNYTGNGVLKYKWIPITGLNNDTIKNPTATVTQTTKYYATVTAPNGCTSIDSITVIVNPLTAEAGIDKTIICGASAQLNNVTTNYTGTGTITYGWYPATGLNSTSISNPIATITQSTKYYVAVTTPNGCIANDSIDVIVNPLIANAGNDKAIICGASAQLDNATSNYTGNDTLTYTWLPIIGLNSNSIPNPITSTNSSITYNLTINTPNGCIANDSIEVVINPLLINAGNDKLKICGDTTQIDSLVTNYTGSGILSFSWNPIIGLNNDTIPNPKTIETGITYTITVNTLNGCIAKDSISILSLPMPNPEICIVGVDSTNKNMVIWNKPYSTAIDSFLIYRETNVTGIYTKIGSISYVSASIFIDNTSNPNIQSDKYKISLLDSCGIESERSIYHKTMHLAINQGVGSTWNLIWDPYEGFTVSTYKIYRGTVANNLQLVGSTSGGNTQYSDFSAPSGYIYYQVEVISPNICNNTKSINSTRSNIATNNPNSIQETSKKLFACKIYPNPAHNELYIESDINEKVYFEIFNSIGQIVFKGELIEKIVLQTSDFVSGIYLIKLNNGKTFQFKKIVKE